MAQLRGYNLLPFHFDKQTCLLVNIITCGLQDQIPLISANVSDWRAAETAINSSRCESPHTDAAPNMEAAADCSVWSRRLLADPLDVIHVDFWTSYIIQNTTALPSVWRAVTSPDPRMWDATSALGIPMNITLLNATRFLARKSPLRDSSNAPVCHVDM